jgi:hypothetical protein
VSSTPWGRPGRWWRRCWSVFRHWRLPPARCSCPAAPAGWHASSGSPGCWRWRPGSVPSTFPPPWPVPPWPRPSPDPPCPSSFWRCSSARPCAMRPCTPGPAPRRQDPPGAVPGEPTGPESPSWSPGPCCPRPPPARCGLPRGWAPRRRRPAPPRTSAHPNNSSRPPRGRCRRPPRTAATVRMPSACSSSPRAMTAAWARY